MGFRQILAAVAHAHGVDLEEVVADKFFGDDELRDWATARSNER